MNVLILDMCHSLSYAPSSSVMGWSHFFFVFSMVPNSFFGIWEFHVSQMHSLPPKIYHNHFRITACHTLVIGCPGHQIWWYKFEKYMYYEIHHIECDLNWGSVHLKFWLCTPTKIYCESGKMLAFPSPAEVEPTEFYCPNQNFLCLFWSPCIVCPICWAIVMSSNVLPPYSQGTFFWKSFILFPFW